MAEILERLRRRLLMRVLIEAFISSAHAVKATIQILLDSLSCNNSYRTTFEFGALIFMPFTSFSAPHKRYN